MTYTIQSVEFETNKKYYKSYFHSLNGGFDDFYEGNMIESTHYQYLIDNEIIATFSINENQRLTHLYVKEDYKDVYSDILENVILYGSVTKLLFVTNDTDIVNEVIKRDNIIEKQACNYIYKTKQPVDLILSLAQLSDLKKIKETCGDFLDNYEEQIKLGNLYLYKKENEVISIVNVIQHVFDNNACSIGMMTNEQYRKQSYGTKSLIYVGNLLLDQGYDVYAGCYYYNDPSKKTLKKAGFTLTNLICRVDAF